MFWDIKWQLFLLPSNRSKPPLRIWTRKSRNIKEKTRECSAGKSETSYWKMASVTGTTFPQVRDFLLCAWKHRGCWKKYLISQRGRTFYSKFFCRIYNCACRHISTYSKHLYFPFSILSERNQSHPAIKVRRSWWWWRVWRWGGEEGNGRERLTD